MISGATIRLAGGSAGAWASVAGYGLGALFFLALIALAIGFNVSRRSPLRIPQLWITAVVSLAAAGFCVLELSRQFTRVAWIEIDPVGTWSLRAPIGRPVGRIAPEARRSLTLWAEARLFKTSPYFDSLHGFLQLENGKQYRLKPSAAFDLLIRLGYGNFWIDHKHPSLSEEEKSKKLNARFVTAGDKMGHGIVLPLHGYDLAGIAEVSRFLASRAR
jgi:hypothetical protein